MQRRTLATLPQVLRRVVAGRGHQLYRVVPRAVVTAGWPSTTVRYKGAWSKELEPHSLTPASEIINVAAIERTMEATKDAAKDANRVREILAKATDKSLLKAPKGQEVIPSADPQHEFVLGLNLDEAATLLNLDPVTQPDLVRPTRSRRQ